MTFWFHILHSNLTMEQWYDNSAFSELIILTLVLFHFHRDGIIYYLQGLLRSAYALAYRHTWYRQRAV